MTRIAALSLTVVAALLAASAAFAGSGPPRSAGTGPPRSASTIVISLPPSIRRHVVYDITLRGYARPRASASLFVDYAGCAATFAGEERRAPHESDSYQVRGRFTEISGWRSSSAGADHACAYLLTRSGAPLASARVTFRVR